VGSSCERGNELSGSIKLLRIYRVAAQLVASRVVLNSTELAIRVPDRQLHTLLEPAFLHPTAESPIDQ
jgi:hypothetical protein